MSMVGNKKVLLGCLFLLMVNNLVVESEMQNDAEVDDVATSNSDFMEVDVQDEDEYDNEKEIDNEGNQELFGEEWHPDPTVANLQKSVEILTRQVLLQQLYIEEMGRSSGHSGLKQIRVTNGGTRPYYSSHHSGYSVASIHDHSNHLRTVGIGEFIAVMNGLEFRTRHNDYMLKMPHPTQKGYHLTKDIPFPDVPDEVLSKRTVGEQMEEMREWFRAFATENVTHRNYKKYFKPVLCYLEGAWTNTGNNLDPSFESDRHHAEAATWYEMQEKVRFTSYTGRKNIRENLMYLPNKIIGVANKTVPILAQWNYRILCHPLQRYIEPSSLKVVDDFGRRLQQKVAYQRFRQRRSARFQILGNYPDKQEERWETYSLLDDLMSEIPGKDNYQGNVTDDSFDLPALKFNSAGKEVLNAAYYHRYYKVGNKGAMGEVRRLRGYSDGKVFVAFNTQDKISGSKLRDCNGKGSNRVCKKYHKKVSYAIPLEIIYLTPLWKWNPYNIQYKGPANSPKGRTVTSGGRTGRWNVRAAFNGTNSKYYFRTPAEFYSNKRGGSAADTSRGVVGVLDRRGRMRKVVASGVYIFLPNITGLGIIRQRYPIMSVYGEGSPVWKEVAALTDAVMQGETYNWLYRERNRNRPTPRPPCYSRLEMSSSFSASADPHTHSVYLDRADYNKLDNLKQNITVTTTQNSGHSHTLLLRRYRNYIAVLRCDNRDTCWDGHEKRLYWKESTGGC